MRIISITTFTKPTVTLVEIVTDTGETGWGQTAPYRNDITSLVLHKMIAPIVLDMPSPTPRSVSEKVLTECLKFPGSFILRALCGIETALWDLLAKRDDKLVCELLGNTIGNYPVYASSMRRDITVNEEVNRLLRMRDAMGFSACKIRVGSDVGLDHDSWEGRSEELIRATRKALGSDYIIHVDANGAFMPKKAIEIGKLLNNYGPGHFEEPCPYWKLDWTKLVTETLAGDVAGGEQDNYMPAWERIIKEHTVDIIQPDICYIGGLSRALDVASLGHEAHIQCTPHAANLSMVTVFSLHFIRSIPNAGPFLEYSIEDQDHFKSIYEPELEVKDGKLIMPNSEPGWGVRINKEWINNAEKQVSCY